jgi:hypothetical protein
VDQLRSEPYGVEMATTVLLAVGSHHHRQPSSNHWSAVVGGFIIGFIGLALTVWPVTHPLWRKIVAIACYAIAGGLLVWGLLPRRWFPFAVVVDVAATVVVIMVMVMRLKKPGEEASEDAERPALLDGNRNKLNITRSKIRGRPAIARGDDNDIIADEVDYD